MNSRLEARSNIWITGASSGIGESVTRALVRGGHNLVVTGRTPETLEQIQVLAPERITPAAAELLSNLVYDHQAAFLSD
ncbi:MAG: SDR family NAD(P)-dependent oxidoreductase [Marinobacter sp.]|nr:SDR family NAD(P)-dependent oxidoreductase [Marinobacter sp.]